jgi:hypothetical protein
MAGVAVSIAVSWAGLALAAAVLFVSEYPFPQPYGAIIRATTAYRFDFLLRQGMCLFISLLGDWMYTGFKVVIGKTSFC